MTPTGVYVIDAKKYRGRPHLKIDGGLFRPRVERLLVGSRDCTKLVDGVLKQVDVVRGILEPGVPVHGVLCFVEADWPLLGGNFTTRDVHALWPKKPLPQAPGGRPPHRRRHRRDPPNSRTGVAGVLGTLAPTGEDSLALLEPVRVIAKVAIVGCPGGRLPLLHFGLRLPKPRMGRLIGFALATVK